MSDQSSQEWFEESWRVREEVLYRELFGDIGPEIYALDPELFASVFRQDSIDPRWVTYGVFECPPSGVRPSWLYVSSGLSNAWEDNSPNPDELSGLGCEFILECQQQSSWALSFLRRMIAFQILLSVGRFPGKGLLNVWDRIPLHSPIDGLASALNWALLVPCPHFGVLQQLPSGKFQFLEFVGITEDEAAYARTHGSDKLLRLLTQQSAAPVTDPERHTVL